MPKNGNHLSCLDGMRFLSISWVVLGHTLNKITAWFSSHDLSYQQKVCFGIIYQNHFTDISHVKVYESFWFQAVDNAFPSVDTFFLMSGCLVTYLMLKELDKSKGRINFPLLYLHRYLR